MVGERIETDTPVLTESEFLCERERKTFILVRQNAK